MRFNDLQARAAALAVAMLPFASAAPAPRGGHQSCENEVVVVHNGARHTTNIACPAAATVVPKSKRGQEAKESKDKEETMRAVGPFIALLEDKEAAKGQQTIIVDKTMSYVSSPTGSANKDAKDAKLGKRQTLGHEHHESKSSRPWYVVVNLGVLTVYPRGGEEGEEGEGKEGEEGEEGGEGEEEGEDGRGRFQESYEEYVRREGVPPQTPRTSGSRRARGAIS